MNREAVRLPVPSHCSSDLRMGDEEERLVQVDPTSLLQEKQNYVN